MMYWGNHMGAGGWIFSILATLIVLGLIVGLIYWAVAASGRRSESGETTPRESAREILDRRLATGELSTDEYQRLRATLNDSPTETPATGSSTTADPPAPRTLSTR